MRERGIEYHKLKIKNKKVNDGVVELPVNNFYKIKINRDELHKHSSI